MSKWIIQLDYEFGEVEPNSIYFRRVCSDDFEYSSAYDTKREALEAFCLGQVSFNQLRKEREAEQKKENYGDNFLPPEGYTNGKERKIMERLKALEEAIRKPYIPFSVREAKDIVYKYQAKVEALEKRLTEIEGVLSSIGSPEWELRKKVEGLERKLLSLTGIVRQLDKRSEGAEKALAKDVARNHEEASRRIEDLEKRLRNY